MQHRKSPRDCWQKQLCLARHYGASCALTYPEDPNSEDEQVSKTSQEPVGLSGLVAQYQSIKSEIDEAISGVLTKQHFILGENVAALEQEVAVYCDVPYAVGVASGTDALILALKAAGIGVGDEVIVPAFTFVATADSVSILGATPVFADIDSSTWNIDVSRLNALVTKATKAIIPVHLYGQPANMVEINEFAAKHNLVVLGDTAQALGAKYRDKPICSYGDFGCLSFFPSKNLGAYGDGGMIVTSNAQYAADLKMLRSHGSRVKYHSEVQGWNSRLDELQAAVLRVKLPHLDRWNTLRAEKAALYSQRLSQIEGVVVPRIDADRTHVFHQYTIEIPNRDDVQRELTEVGVQTAVHYPVPLHLQPMFRHLGYKRGDLPAAERASQRVLSLPIYPELADQQIEQVCGSIQLALEHATQLVAK
jgi:dTDP-4-amino-4,6-dideoxygalactose transaminase